MTRDIIRKINIENVHYFFLFQKNYRTQYPRKTVKKIRAKPRNYLSPLPETVSLHCFTFFWFTSLQSFIFEILWSRKSEMRSRKSEAGRSSSAFVQSSLLLGRLVFRKVGASDWWWTARDHGKGADGSFPPSFARSFSSRERRLGTRQEPEEYLFDP